MNRVLTLFKSWRFVFLALAGGAVGAWKLPSDFADIASAELVALFSLVIAAVLPAMMLTSTVLRGNVLSVTRVEQLNKALLRQMNFWAGLLLISFSGAVATIALKSFVSCKGEQHCNSHIFLDLNVFSINSSWVNFAIGYLISLLIGRFVDVTSGVKSLLELNYELAKKEAEKNLSEELARQDKAFAEIKSPIGFGGHVDLPKI